MPIAPNQIDHGATHLDTAPRQAGNAVFAAPDNKALQRPAEARQARMGQAFAQIVAVLMRDPGYRNLRLTDLEWLVLPPVMAGQWRLGQGPAPTPGNNASVQGAGGAMLVPMAVALWARISPSIEQRLKDNLEIPLMLRPDEWASGPNLWLIAAAGDPRYLPVFLQKLNELEFQGQEVKQRVRGADGKAVVMTLDQYVQRTFPAAA